jgi:hypothetical protein
MYREKRIRDAVWRQVLEKHGNELGGNRWESVKKTLSMFRVSMLCFMAHARAHARKRADVQKRYQHVRRMVSCREEDRQDARCVCKCAKESENAVAGKVQES